MKENIMNIPLRTRKGMTGLETAIILVAFVISAAAFSFIVLNMGFLTAQKSQTVISAGMSDATSSLQADGDVTGVFDMSSGNMTEAFFYIRLSQGREPVDSSGDKVVVTYSNPRVSGVIKDQVKTGANITQVVGDNDALIEFGERWVVSIDFASVAGAAILNTNDAYCGAYDNFRIDVRPAQGSVLSIARSIPPVNADIIILE